MQVTWRSRCFMSILIVVLATCIGTAGEYSARAYSMGGAYNALSADVTGLAYNPGGLGQRSFEIAGSLGSTDKDALSKLRSALDGPVDLGQDHDVRSLIAVGLGPVAAGLLIDGKYTVETKNGNKTIDAELHRGSTLGAGFTVIAAPLNVGKLRVGFQIQHNDIQRRQFEIDAVTAAMTERAWDGSGYSLAVGALANITELVTVGVAARDVMTQTHWTGTTTVGGMTTVEPAYTEKMVPVTSGSVAVKLPFPKITLAVDGDTTGALRFGAETNFLLNALSLRAGQIRPKDASPITTAGLGINLGPFKAGIGVGTKDSFKALDAAFADVSIRF